MTANCTTTHFYAGGLAVASGEAVYESPDGGSRRVVCTTPRSADEIHFRDLDEGAVLSYTVNGVTLRLPFFGDAALGAAGRSAYATAIAAIDDPRERREFVAASLRHLPAAARESRRFCDEVAADFLSVVHDDYPTLADAVVTTPLLNYGDATRTLSHLAQDTERYRGALTRLVDQAVESVSNPRSATAAIAQVSRALDLVEHWPESITSDQARDLSAAIAILHDTPTTSSPADDLAARLALAVPAPATAAEPTPVTDSATAERLAKMDELRAVLATEYHRVSQMEMPTANAVAQVTNAIADAQYRSTDEEVRRVLGRAAADQEDFAARDRRVREMVRNDFGDEMRAVAATETRLSEDVFTQLNESGSTLDERARADLLRTVERHLTEMDQRARHAYDSAAAEVAALSAQARYHLTSVAGALQSLPLDPSDASAILGALSRQGNYQDLASALTAHYEQNRRLRQHVWDTIEAALGSASA